jgi:hypothetical protein
MARYHETDAPTRAPAAQPVAPDRAPAPPGKPVGEEESKCRGRSGLKVRVRAAPKLYLGGPVVSRHEGRNMHGVPNGTKLRAIEAEETASLPTQSAIFPPKGHLIPPPGPTNMLNLVPLHGVPRSRGIIGNLAAGLPMMSLNGKSRMKSNRKS